MLPVNLRLNNAFDIEHWPHIVTDFNRKALICSALYNGPADRFSKRPQGFFMRGVDVIQFLPLIIQRGYVIGS